MFVDNLTFEEQQLALTELQAFVNNLAFDEEEHVDSISNDSCSWFWHRVLADNTGVLGNDDHPVNEAEINEDTDGGGAEASEEIDGSEEASEIRDVHIDDPSSQQRNMLFVGNAEQYPDTEFITYETPDLFLANDLNADSGGVKSRRRSDNTGVLGNDDHPVNEAEINEDIDGGGAEASEEIDGSEEASEIRDVHIDDPSSQQRNMLFVDNAEQYPDTEFITYETPDLFLANDLNADSGGVKSRRRC
ncbi:hypothetical protein E3N88_19475 [Mikania micrantha]|uniref:Uncharacterized protein n=1 Tax=Mikania micrantha TaxID=192012 RepID=A0A5N6NPN5_9ASTR|nr:hypothetical protein E3N88_19475 [Mikania micrantha]